MYYTKELFVNEEIRAKYNRLIKLQTALAIASPVIIVAVYLAVTIPLWVKYGEAFMVGYSMAILFTSLFVALYTVLFPILRALNKLRLEQTESMKGHPVYGKYIALLQAAWELNKVNNIVSIVAAVLGLAATWTLAILFPYELYVYIPCLFTILVSSSIILIGNGKVKKIKSMEEEIALQLRQENNNADGTVT